MFALTPEYVPAYLQAGQLLVRMGRAAEAAVEVFRHGIQVAKQQHDEHAAGEMESVSAADQLTCLAAASGRPKSYYRRPEGGR